MKREPIKASEEHEKEFRRVWKLKEEFADNPLWQAAFEHAATYKLWPDELEGIACVIERKTYRTSCEEPHPKQEF